MTVLDLHIDFQQKLQLNSNVLDQLDPNEIDWWLNLGQYRVIKTRINPIVDPRREGYAAGIDRIEDINNLVKEVTIPLKKLDLESMYVELPSDYLYLLNSQTSLFSQCESIDLTTLEQTETTEKIGTLTFTDSTTTPPYSNWELRINGTTIIVSTSFTNFTGLNDNSEFLLILPQLIKAIQDAGYNAYWERYGNQYYYKQLVIVGDLSSIEFDLDGGSGGGGVTITSSIVDHDYVSYNVTPNKKSPNRLISSSIIKDMLNHSFGTTKENGPLLCRRDRNFILFHKGRFAPKDITLEYISKPDPISIYFEIGAELPSGEVVDQAIATYSSRILSFNYQTIAQDTVFND